MHRHLDRHLNEIVFTKCNDRTCCREWKSEEVLRHFNNSQVDVKFPAPTQSNQCVGHYKTFLQECTNQTKRYGHEGQPTAVADNLGSCKFGGKAYNFKSKTAKAKRMSVFHRRQTKVVSSTNYKCHMADCGRVFQSLSSLNRHKNKEGHTTRKNRKEAAGKKPNESKKRQRTLQDLLQGAEARNGLEEEKACAALECIISSDNSSEIDWIQCDTCGRWLHAICVGVEDSSEIEHFLCHSCE